MKLKLTATIKKEALLPGMETAMQDVELQKELNKPGIVQQVNKSDQVKESQAVKKLRSQALDQLQQVKYKSEGDWDGQQLITDLESLMKKSDIDFGIGVARPNRLRDIMVQREEAENAARLNLQKRKGLQDQTIIDAEQWLVGPRRYFDDEAGNVYVLVYSWKY